MVVDPFPNLQTGLRGPEHHLSIFPIGPSPAVIVQCASDFKRMIIVNEIIAAKLPEEHGGPNVIHHFVEN